MSIPFSHSPLSHILQICSFGELYESVRESMQVLGRILQICSFGESSEWRISENSEEFRMYVDSDNESTDSDSDSIIPWRDTYYSVGDLLLSHKYIAEKNSVHLIDNDTFCKNIGTMILNMNRLYGNKLKAMYLPITLGNSETSEIRFNVSEILRTHFIDDLLEYVENGIIPLYANLDDKTKHKIQYLISYVKFSVHKKPLFNTHVTIIHPGFYVKEISSFDHRVIYGKKDRILMCLNEHTKKNLKPDDVRAKVWPDVPRNMAVKKEFTRGRHILALADIYQISIFIYFIETRETLKFRNYSESIQLVKIGTCVGIFEKYVALEPKERNEDFFDLDDEFDF